MLVVAEQLRRAVPGGIGTAGLGLLRGLATLARGEAPSVTLYASRARSVPDPLAATGYPVLTSRLPAPVLTRAWDRGVLGVPGGFGVVHTLSLAVPPTGRVPLVATVHDMAWRHHPDAYPTRGRRWHEAALVRALRKASHFVVPADVVAAELVAAGAAPDAVSVVPLGCDHLPDPDDAAAGAVLARLGVAGEFVLAVGTLEPRKNLPRLFDAYDKARSALAPSCALVVVGPSGWGDTVAPRPGVVLAGPVDGATLAALYRRTRLLVYVPLEEGFGLPPVEAMREGAPVVASPVPSTGGAALEVDPTDVDAIAAGIVAAAVDEDTRARLRAAGAARAASLTWRSTAAAVVALWRSLS
ncbi:MAG: glycosyltransferase family 1 protein [Acidimicrobiales bacterium]